MSYEFNGLVMMFLSLCTFSLNRNVKEKENKLEGLLSCQITRSKTSKIKTKSISEKMENWITGWKNPFKVTWTHTISFS